MEIDWLYRQPHRRMKAHINRLNLGDTYLFLLAQSSLLNLAGAATVGGTSVPPTQKGADYGTTHQRLGTGWPERRVKGSEGGTRGRYVWVRWESRRPARSILLQGECSCNPRG
jgi:hypothetical protein